MTIKTIKHLLKSTLIVLLISGLTGYAVYYNGGSFISSFILSFCIQYVLFSFTANIIKSYFKQKTYQMELDNLEKLSTILQCAYCNTQNVMTFIPDELDASEFICTSCEKKNTVKLQFVVARKTDMLQIPVSSKGVSLKDKDFE